MNQTSPSRSPSNLQLVIRGHERSLVQNGQELARQNIAQELVQNGQEIARQNNAQELQGSHAQACCPLCQRQLPQGLQQETRLPEPAFAFAQRTLEPDYFRSLQPTPENSRPSTPVQATERDHELSEESFVPGYFSKFFSKQRSLGRGARGTVYLVQHVLEQHQLGFYACKVVSVGDSSASLMSSLREIKHLESLRHPNITTYHHSWLEAAFQTTPFAPEVPHLFILMSFANGGSLEDFVAARRNRHEASSDTSGDLRKQAFRASRGKRQMAVHYLRVDEICALFRDITSGLEFLHAHNILHLDLKADNVLLNWEDLDHPLPTCLLSDFGSSTAKGTARTRSGATGTLDYLAPECLQTDPRTGLLREQDFKADLWSLGLLLHVLCFLRLPYKHEEVDPLTDEISSYPGYIMHDTLRHDLPFALERLMSQLVNLDPQKRPSAAEVLRQLDLITLNSVKDDSHAVVHRPARSPTHQRELLQDHSDQQALARPVQRLVRLTGLSKATLGKRAVVAFCIAMKLLLRQSDHASLSYFALLAVLTEIMCMNIMLSASLTVLYVAVYCTA